MVANRFFYNNERSDILIINFSIEINRKFLFNIKFIISKYKYNIQYLLINLKGSNQRW